MDSNPTSPAPRSAEPQSPLPSSGQSGGQSDAPAVEAPALSPMDTTAVNEGASTSDGTGASVPELTEPCKLPNGKGDLHRLSMLLHWTSLLHPGRWFLCQVKLLTVRYTSCNVNGVELHIYCSVLVSGATYERKMFNLSGFVYGSMHFIF